MTAVTGMIAPAVSMARSRIGGLIAVACAVAGGAAIATATGVLVESGIASHAPLERLSAADLTVSAQQYVVQDEDVDVALTERVPVPSSLVDKVTKVPGVAAAAVDVSFPATILHGDGELATNPSVAGHDWDIAELGAPKLSGTAPGGDGEVALDSEVPGAKVGDEVTLLVNGEKQRYSVSGVVDAPGSGVYFDSGTATKLAGHKDGETDLIAVTVDKGASVDTVAEAVRSATAKSAVEVSSGAELGDVENLGATASRGVLIELSGALGGTIVMIVGFIVAGALSVSVAGQRRDLALLRAVGATPRQVRRLIATQATVVAGVSVAVGVTAGYALAEQFANGMRSSGMLLETLPLSWGPLPGIAAATLLLLVTQLAARMASMRASRMSAVEAVAESRVEPGDPSPVRIVFGFVLMGLALASAAVPLIIRGESAFVSAASSIIPALIGLSLAAPALVRTVTGRIKRRLRPHGSAATWMAVANSHGYALRMAGALTVLALAVGFAIMQVFSQTALQAVTDDELTSATTIDATVTAPRTGGLTDRDTEQVAEQRGVEAAVPLLRTTVLWPFMEGDNKRAEALPMLAFGSGASSVIDADVVDGDLGKLTGDTIALDSTTAGIEDVGIGDRVDLILADGSKVKPTIVAIYSRGFGFGKLIGSTDLVTGHVANQHYDAIAVAGESSTLSGWTADNPGRELSPGAAAAGLAEGGVAPDRWVNLVVTLALLGYVLLGVGNSLVAATTRRRSEFAALRLIGATPAQIRAMMGREAMLMTVLAVGAGLTLSVVPQSILGLGLLGLPWPQGPLWLIPAMALLVAGIAWLATAIPTRRALLLPPTEALPAQD